MVQRLPLQLVVSPKEYAYLQRLVQKRQAGKDESQAADAGQPQAVQAKDDFNIAALRAATRVYLGTHLSLELLHAVLSGIARKRDPRAPPRAPLVPARARFALSFSSLLFTHRILHRLLTRLRLQLLHEKVQTIKERYPRIYNILTSRLAPAIGASLSGFALGICPSDQLRVTIAIFVACRALEVAYTTVEGLGYVRNKPWWFGSWLLFPLCQGQLLHAFVFDRDCFPESYGSFILSHTPEYIQRRPSTLSPKVAWPSSSQIVDSLAEMARLHWPPFISPILHPANPNTLPSTINPVITPITSRASPALTHLSCALIHPTQTSCFIAYLRQNLLAFPQLARFFTLYYGAFSLLRIKQLFKSPVSFLNRLAEQVLRTTLALGGAIGFSWASICFFQNLLPHSLLPKFRFFLGGLLGGTFQIVDRTPAGHANALYAARTSVDSLWKVGVKRRWWRPVKAGDVLLFVASAALINVCVDLGRDTAELRTDRIVRLVGFLRGDEAGDVTVDEVKGEGVKTERNALGESQWEVVGEKKE